MHSFEWLRPTVEATVARVRALGAEVLRYNVGAPAGEAGLKKVEERIGGSLPEELRSLFRTFAGHFDLCWQLEFPKRQDADAPFGGSLWGEFSYSLGELRIVAPWDYWWAEDIVEGRATGEWHKKLHLHTAPDGDFLAFGLEARIAGKAVYVPHDGTRSRYLVLGDSLRGFLEDWARTGFLSINGFWQFQDDAIERLPWDAFRKEVEFLAIPRS